MPTDTHSSDLEADSALVDRLTAIRASLDRARAEWGELGETTLDSGLAYRRGEPVEVLVRKRQRRYDISDDGRAVRAAGTPAGWLDRAEEVVAEAGLNVNRRGVVFVPAVEGRDIASLALLVAETSLAVYSTLLDSDVERP